MSPSTPQFSRRSMLAAGASLAVLPHLAFGQEKYPSRPIEFVVPWGAGGGADQLARRLGKLLEAELKVSLPILNVPGATGNTGTTKLLSAPADGHSIAVLISDTLGTVAAGSGRWKLADIVPLGVMIQQPSGLFVKQDAKWKSFAELLEDSRQREIKVAVTGFGSPEEIQALQLNQKGSKVRIVPFASPGDRYASILGGHADVLVEQAGDVRTFLESKQMRPLVFFADEPQASFRDIPLARDSGFPIVISQFRAIVVRAGTDAARIATMAAALERAARSENFKTYLQEEMAFADSFVPQQEAQAFLERQLRLIESSLQKKAA